MPLEQLGRYEIVEELGRGSMGVVYKARDPLLDRTVALKTVALELSGEEAEAFEQRFYREAKSAGRLSHPNIVTIHDVGRTDSVAYIAMEFLRGRSLRDILDSGVVLPVERIVDIAGQVADGLAFAHASGVVHRDIKPPNIMVLDSGAVKITDFGIALLPTGSRTLAGTVFGSPKYMSPEQVVGRPVDGRADVFSLGAVLYEMLTGFAPFFGGDLEAILYRVLNEMPAPPTSRNRALPAALDYVAAKALAKHPDDRYGDAQAFARDLRGYRELRPPIESLPGQRTLERRAISRRKGEKPRQPPIGASSDGAEAVSVAAAASAAAVADDAARAAVPASRGPGLRAAVLVGVPVALLFLGGAAAWVRLVSHALAPAQRDAAAILKPPGGPATPVSAVLPGGEPRTRFALQAQASSTSAPSATATTSAPPATATTSASPVTAATSTPPATATRASPARAATRAAASARAADRSSAKPLARLFLMISPWGEVYVDGRKRGISPPLAEIRVAPGRHTVEIRNTTFAPHAEIVDLGAAATVKIRHRFR